MSNHDYEAEIEILSDGYSSSKFAVSVAINFDYTPPQRQTYTDPPWPAEVSVNSVKLTRNGEAAECPKWLEEIILNSIDEEVLVRLVEEEDA